MGVVNHPIILDNTNICDLVRTGDLNQLKVSKLKEICLQGHLQYCAKVMIANFVEFRALFSTKFRFGDMRNFL